MTGYFQNLGYINRYYYEHAKHSMYLHTRSIEWFLWGIYHEKIWIIP